MARAEVIKSKHCCWDSLRTDRVKHSEECMAMKDTAQAACEELIRRAVVAERERCAKIAEAWKDPDGGYCDGDPASDIAGQIRGIVIPAEVCIVRTLGPWAALEDGIIRLDFRPGIVSTPQQTLDYLQKVLHDNGFNMPNPDVQPDCICGKIFKC
jgi:hypothetical protein